jgi:hypothetical protein
VVVAVAGNNLEPYHSPGMSSNPKTNEWNLLKEEFDALVRNDVVREDSLEQPKLSSSSPFWRVDSLLSRVPDGGLLWLD